jgi:hypothetical protein
MDPQQSTVNMCRLAVITHGQPLINDANWTDLATLGWHWSTNIKLVEYTVAVQAIKALQKTYGRENVTIGHPFDRNLHKPVVGTEFVGIYIKDIKELVFTLYRDMSKWERLNTEELKDL